MSTWQVTCGKHLPFAVEFVILAGVSRHWLRDRPRGVGLLRWRLRGCVCLEFGLRRDPGGQGVSRRDNTIVESGSGLALRLAS